MGHEKNKVVDICCFEEEEEEEEEGAGAGAGAGGIKGSKEKSNLQQFEEVDLKLQLNDDDHDASDEPNLDSGYAWIILGVMFLLSSTTSGTSRVYGLVYARQISINYYDHEEASWPIATASTIENLAGVLTPALAQYLSWRQIQLLSTSLFIISNLGAYFSDSLLIDILCLGIIQGLALSTGTVLLLAINNDYFERFRTTAYGIGMSGATCGVLFLCPVVNLILDSDQTTFRPVYLFIALVLVLNLILSLFIKPRAETKSYKRFKEEQSLKIKQQENVDVVDTKKDSFCSLENNNNNNINRNRLSITRRLSTKFETHLERKNSIASVNYAISSKRNSRFSSYSSGDNRLGTKKKFNKWTTKSFHIGGTKINNNIDNNININKNGLDKRNGSKSFHFNSSKFDYNNSNNNNNNTSITTLSTTIGSHLEDSSSENISAYRRQSIFDEINNLRQPPYPLDISTKIIIDDPASETTTTTTPEAEEEEERVNNNAVVINSKASNDAIEKKNNNNNVDIKKELKGEEGEKVFTLLDSLKLLRSPYLHCVWIMLTIYYLVSRIYIIILADFGKDHGLTHSQSYQLLNYWSLGELLGRVVLATLIDLRWISVKSCIILTCLFLAASIMIMVLLENFYVYAICSTITAALVSLEYMLINALMVEYLGKNKAIGCYSVAALISSLILFGRPTLIGIFRDHLGSYDGLLILLALISLAYALLFALFEPVFVRYWPKTIQLNRFK